MGLHFGDLAKVRHIITFSLSPFEQKAFPNYFTKGIPNTWRRFRSQVFIVGPPFLIAYVINRWAHHEYAMSKRKKLTDYSDDE